MTDSRPRIVCFGECMLELSRRPDGTAGLGFGGDTLNTALYLARLGGDVAYATALGIDPWSDELRAAWAEEGLDDTLVLTDPDRVPGLYAIRTDDDGERTFTYWRDRSAARNFFRLEGLDRAVARMNGADLFYLSGITLSLFDYVDRAVIGRIARIVRDNGGRVAFDPNYRSRNWSSPGAAQAAMSAFAPLVDIALPTFEDEHALMGDRTPSDTAARWRRAGAALVVVKQGPDGALVSDRDGERIVPTRPLRPIDTTGAGDSFNAGFLNSWLEGASADEATSAGHRMAAAVITHRGAIIGREFMPTP